MEVNTLAAVPLHNSDVVLLDLDNTLYEYKRCHEYALDKLLKACEATLNLPSRSRCIAIARLIRGVCEEMASLEAVGFGTFLSVCGQVR